jgi:hypothetical protein
MKQRLTTIILLLLLLHGLFSLAFIFDPSVLPPSRLATFYKVYLLPGPFFTESRIIESQSLHLSWKMKDQWQPPINPSKENYDNYCSCFNPTNLFRSRLERTFYLRLLREPYASLEKKERAKEIEQLRQYLSDTYVPKEADSVRILILNRRAQNFKVRVDSLQMIFAR